MRAAESESGPELESVGSTVLAGVGVGAGVGKIWPTLTPGRSRRPHPATEYDFGRTIMHSPENIARIFVWGLQTWKLCNAKTVNVALTTLTHMAQFLNFEQLLTDMCWDSKKDPWPWEILDSIFLIFLEILEILDPTLAMSLRDPVDFGSQDEKSLPTPVDFGLCT